MIRPDPKADAPTLKGFHAETVPGAGFDDDGERIATTEAPTAEEIDQHLAEEEAVRNATDIQRARLETIDRLVAWFCEGTKTDSRIGRRVQLCAHVLRAPTAPKSQRALAKAWGVSEAAVSADVKRFRQKLREITE